MAKTFYLKKGQAVFCMSISTVCLTRYSARQLTILYERLIVPGIDI